jgi:hypothetical protein
MTAHAEIVDMNVLSGRNRAGGNADGLAVAEHLLAFGNRAHRNLVSARHRFGERPSSPGTFAPPARSLRAMITLSAALRRIVCGRSLVIGQSASWLQSRIGDRISGRIVA